MTSRQDWPKPDFLQQRRLELGLPLDPAPVPSPLSLLLKGSMGAVVLVTLVVLTLLALQRRQQLVQFEVDALNWDWCSGECCRCGVGGDTSPAQGARFGGEAKHLAQSSAQCSRFGTSAQPG